MATIAFEEPYERDTARPPISLHPAFPVIVALWFAALLGLGSLVLPVVLLERAVEATGIAALVSAASPPLGFTARGILAIAAGLAGAAIGVAIARRVAQAHRPKPESRITKLSGGSRRPISIKDEVGGHGVVNGESLPISRRRALAISEDDRPSDFLYQAPLPGDRSDAQAEEFTGEPEPLELSDLAEVAPEPARSDAHDEGNHADIEMTESREFQPASPAQPFDSTRRELSDGGEIGERPLSTAPRGPEPLPFSPPSLARRADEPEPILPAEADGQLAAVDDCAVSPDSAFHADWETAPLDGLGLVQLVQRLGSTIERRRELMAQAAPLSDPAPLASDPGEIEAAPAEEAAQAMAAYFASAPTDTAAPGDGPHEQPPEAAFTGELDRSAPSPLARPGLLHAFAIEDDDEDEDEGAIPDFSLPLRRPAAPSFAPADNDAEENADDGYSSLLGMGNPFTAPKEEFVRIEEPEPVADPPEPAVVFPGQEEPAARLFDPPGKAARPVAPAPADADAALRAALATLQRMSGAA